jgi:hypothetical protein
VTYRAELSQRALRQLGDFPAKAFDALIEAMARVVEYPDNPMGSFPTSDLGWLTASAACPHISGRLSRYYGQYVVRCVRN